MSSYITTSNGPRRPSWNYSRPRDDSWTTYDRANIEMLESIRNFLEGCQMMQCDVAHAIKRMDKTLERIDRRLAKIEGAKLR